ncbi:hypothetical protein IGI04_011967 [Brassica rapa subsp. trilocularis]|uniref:NADH:quinone oxidoreductase/Mrp antiporter membrane subunit domain-containing protein n=1 Tax=Brassica rapa subsp. trilocularis TaxID=1813537 RepID=A0ABQ7N4K6_BRACM|nr:hypothetical protein IGI04_011967 [Brassica rapa subsp. trilocularis]
MVGLAIFWEAVDPLSPSSPAYGLREGMAPIVSFFVGFSSGQFGCSRFTLLIFSSPIVSWSAILLRFFALIFREGCFVLVGFFTDSASSVTELRRVSALTLEEGRSICILTRVF